MQAERASRERPQVLLAVDHLSDEQHALVTEACGRLGIGAAAWKSTDSALQRPARLLIAALGTGIRRIPEPILSFAQQSRETRVLLLCSEPLIRPTMTSHGGRLTLIGSPITMSRLMSRLRAVLAPDQWQGEEESGVGGRSGHNVCAHELRTARYWMGVVASGVVPPRPHADEMGRLSVVIPQTEEEARRVTSEAAAQLFDRARHDDEMERALSDLLGTGSAAVHLAAGAAEWLLYWPWGGGSLSVYSPMRLPALTDLSMPLRRSGRRLFRMTAAGGDVVAAVTANGIAVDAVPRAAIIDGGPALADVLLGPDFEQRRPFSGVLVEVL